MKSMEQGDEENGGSERGRTEEVDEYDGGSG
jgi:hypothetical protein